MVFFWIFQLINGKQVVFCDRDHMNVQLNLNGKILKEIICQGQQFNH